MASFYRMITNILNISVAYSNTPLFWHSCVCRLRLWFWWLRLASGFHLHSGRLHLKAHAGTQAKELQTTRSLFFIYRLQRWKKPSQMLRTHTNCSCNVWTSHWPRQPLGKSQQHQGGGSLHSVNPNAAKSHGPGKEGSIYNQKRRKSWEWSPHFPSVPSLGYCEDNQVSMGNV